MLSPDAEEPLLAAELDPTKIYCVGGIVDRTVTKGMTTAFAVSASVSGFGSCCVAVCFGYPWPVATQIWLTWSPYPKQCGR